MPIIVPNDFVFSQSNLQTYADCARRFLLTYVQRLPWPAVEVSPVHEHEYLMRLGQAFHRAIQRTEVGIDPKLVAAQLEDPLDTWYADYLRHRPRDLPKETVEIESSLTIPFQLSEAGPSVRITAKYDLLAVEPGTRAVIVDWKTTRKRSDAQMLRKRLQTQIYPFLVIEASKTLSWGPLEPAQVEMRYWFTSAPDDPIVIRYDAAQHAANGQLLQRLIAQVLAGQSEADFPMLPDTEANRSRVCAYCAYRSRCDRGVLAGDLDDAIDFEDTFEAPGDLEIRLDDVPEISF